MFVYTCITGVDNEGVQPSKEAKNQDPTPVVSQGTYLLCLNIYIFFSTRLGLYDLCKCVYIFLMFVL
jgi:hypothetical protein